MLILLDLKAKDFGLESDDANSSAATRGEASSPSAASHPQVPLAHSMLNAICDLLFCPEFTVAPNKNAARDEVDDLSSLDSCEYIWASGTCLDQLSSRGVTLGLKLEMNLSSILYF